MQSRPLRIILTVFFIGLLATPFIIKRLSERNELSNYGLSFKEGAKASGIDFIHVPPKLDPKLDHIMPQIASMGAAGSVGYFCRGAGQEPYTTEDQPRT